MKRKHSAADWFNLGIAVVVFVAVLGLGIYLLAKGISDHKTGEIVGGSFLALIGGIVPGVLVFYMLQGAARKAVPGMAPPKITLTIDGAAFAPGAEVTGRVDVTDSGHSRKLEVALHCHDSTADYKGVSWTGIGPPLASGNLTAPQSYNFSLVLPPDAAPNFSSGGATIWWEVEARIDVIGSDARVAQQIAVALPQKQPA
jgi:hypothetical protein